jgi:hypothetical protein
MIGLAVPLVTTVGAIIGQLRRTRCCCGGHESDGEDEGGGGSDQAAIEPIAATSFSPSLEGRIIYLTVPA